MEGLKVTSECVENGALTYEQMIAYAQKRAAETNQYSWRALQFDLREWPEEFGRILMATILKMEEHGIGRWSGV